MEQLHNDLLQPVPTTLRVQGTNAVVVVGQNMTIGTTVNLVSGTVYSDATLPTVNMARGSLYHRSGTMTALNLDGGTCYYESTGTLTTLRASATGVIDFTRNNRARTVTNATFTKGSGYRDPRDTVTWTNGKDLYGCSLDELSVHEDPKHKTVSLSTI